MQMAISFDTLGYAKSLQKAGVSPKQAEAHAEAARDYIMSELVTKSDLAAALEAQTLRLTVRLGALMVAGVGALAILLRLT
jgi:hypothetical protein